MEVVIIMLAALVIMLAIVLMLFVCEGPRSVVFVKPETASRERPPPPYVPTETEL